MSLPFAIDLTRRRFAAGSRGSDGRWEAGASADAALVGEWHATTGRDLERLPEGQRTRDVRTLWTEGDVRTLDLAAGDAADHVSADGTTFYEVAWIAEHDASAPIPHTKALCVRLQETA